MRPGILAVVLATAVACGGLAPSFSSNTAGRDRAADVASVLGAPIAAAATCDFSDFGVDDHGWWTPPTAITPDVYVAQQGDAWTFARREGTTLWFKAISH